TVLAAAFAKKPRHHWRALLENTDACFAPVLTMDEAKNHAHLRSRKTLIDVAGIVQPAPAPRFSRSIPDIPKPPRAHDPADYEQILSGWLPSADVASALDIINETSRRTTDTSTSTNSSSGADGQGRHACAPCGRAHIG